MRPRTLTELLKLAPHEAQALRIHDVDEFEKVLLALLDRKRPPVRTLVPRLALYSGLSGDRVAEAASIILAGRARRKTPGLIRPHVRSIAYTVVPILFLVSAWYWRDRPAPASVRLAVRDDRAIKPFTPIDAGDLKTAQFAGAGGFTDPRDVAGRYSASGIPGGTVLTAGALSATGLAGLEKLWLVPLTASNLPAALTENLPVRVGLALSPKPQTSGLAETLSAVWLVAEERNGASSRIVVALPPEAAAQLASRLATVEVTMLAVR